MTSFQLLAGTGGSGQVFGQSGVKGQFVEFDPTIRLITKGIKDFSLVDANKYLIDARDKVMIPSIKKTFQVEGARRPKKWVPLASYTLDVRQREGYPSGPILQRSGKLFRAAKMRARWSLKGLKTGDAVMEYGNFKQPVSKYAIIHQAGYESSAVGGGYAKRIPARPFAIIQQKDQTDLLKLLEVHSDRRWQNVMPKPQKTI